MTLWLERIEKALTWWIAGHAVARQKRALEERRAAEARAVRPDAHASHVSTSQHLARPLMSLHRAHCCCHYDGDSRQMFVAKRGIYKLHVPVSYTAVGILMTASPSSCAHIDAFTYML